MWHINLNLFFPKISKISLILLLDKVLQCWKSRNLHNYFNLHVCLSLQRRLSVPSFLTKTCSLGHPQTYRACLIWSLATSISIMFFQNLQNFAAVFHFFFKWAGLITLCSLDHVTTYSNFCYVSRVQNKHLGTDYTMKSPRLGSYCTSYLHT